MGNLIPIPKPSLGMWFTNLIHSFTTLLLTNQSDMRVSVWARERERDGRTGNRKKKERCAQDLCVWWWCSSLETLAETDWEMNLIRVKCLECWNVFGCPPCVKIEISHGFETLRVIIAMQFGHTSPKPTGPNGYNLRLYSYLLFGDCLFSLKVRTFDSPQKNNFIDYAARNGLKRPMSQSKIPTTSGW